MARLILHGRRADVELAPDHEDDQTVHATCVAHWLTRDPEDGMDPCSWTKQYDTMSDATDFASDHADEGEPTLAHS